MGCQFGVNFGRKADCKLDDETCDLGLSSPDATWKAPPAEQGRDGPCTRKVRSRMTRKTTVCFGRCLLFGCFGPTFFWGCAHSTGPRTDLIGNPGFQGISIAVAPAINLSGSRDFDPNRFADWMAVELGHADGITVIPVSRVLAAQNAEGLDGARSPAQAEELAGKLGADALLVFAVTHYDPYDPPSIGITAQLYGKELRKGERPADATGGGNHRGNPHGDVEGDLPRAASHTQRIFDAASQSDLAELQDFARPRTAEKSAYGWRKYVVSQQHFIRFCCNATIKALLGGGGEGNASETKTKLVGKP